VQPAQLGRLDWLWVVLHRNGMIPHSHFFVLFPLVPLFGMMALGYIFIFGKLFDKPVRAAIAHDAPQYFRQSQVTGNLALIDQLTHYPSVEISTEMKRQALPSCLLVVWGEFYLVNSFRSMESPIAL
jgi:hypothetical protein